MSTTMMSRSIRALALASLAAATLPASANPGAAVRTYTCPPEKLRWIDLTGKPEVPLMTMTGPVAPGDVVKVRAELGVTNDVATKTKQDGAFSYKGEWRYRIRVSGDLRLAPDGKAGSGQSVVKGSVNVSPQNHHHSLVIAGSRTIDTGDAGAVQVNFVASSEVPGAKKAPTGAVKPSYKGAKLPPNKKPSTRLDRKGRVDVLVLASGWEATFASSALSTTSKDVLEPSLEPREKVVAISMSLGPVKQGEVFDISARLRLSSKNVRPQLVSGKLVFTDKKNGTSGKQVSAHHGFNVPAGATETFEKVGCFTADKDYPNGAYVNLVVNSNAQTPNPPRHLRIDPGKSKMLGTRYTPR